MTNILDTDGGSIRYYIHQLGNPQNPTFALLIRPAPHKLNEVQIKWNQGKKKSQQEPANKPFNSPKLNKGRSISIPIAASSQLSSHMHDGVHSGHRSRHTPDRLLLSLYPGGAVAGTTGFAGHRWGLRSMIQAWVVRMAAPKRTLSLLAPVSLV